MERRLGRWRAGRRSQRAGDGRGEDAVRPEDRAAVAAALREVARREKGGDTVGAAQCYARADQLGSGEGAANLGVLLFERGEVAAAEAVLRRAARRHHPMGTFRLGFLLDQTRRSDEAIATYRRAAVLGNVHAMNNLGYVLQQRRDLAGARAVYQLIVDDGTDKAAVREARRVLARLGATSRPRAVPPADFDPEASAVDSLLWVAGDPADERVQRARTFVLAQLEPPLRGDLAALLERLDRDELDPAHLRAAPYRTSKRLWPRVGSIRSPSASLRSAPAGACSTSGPTTRWPCRPRWVRRSSWPRPSSRAIGCRRRGTAPTRPCMRGSGGASSTSATPRRTSP